MSPPLAGGEGEAGPLDGKATAIFEDEGPQTVLVAHHADRLGDWGRAEAYASRPCELALPRPAS